MIDLHIDPAALSRNVKIAKAAGVEIPTFAQMKNPETLPPRILEKLRRTGLWALDSANLFRITWKNEPKAEGGLFGDTNVLEFPSELTGVKCRIVALVGKWFPTGCHKVGASFACLAPRLVTGQFDASRQRAVWPSTGNYCRGGAFNSRLLGAQGVAILPAEMSRERFDWLKSIGAEVIATPGCESNVKEIFDKTNELKHDDNYMVFNQFEEMGNHLWHYEVTGSALAESFERIRRPGDRFAGACFTTGSAGTIGAGDHLKELYPTLKLAAGESLQCPTLLRNGFGAHRIEGIGDKHVPWIHNVKNTDLAIAIDDADCLALLRLFNEPEGRAYLTQQLGIADEFAEKLGLLGISGIANLLCCIKLAKYYELNEHDVVATVLTDSAEMYGSRLTELTESDGAYSASGAAFDYALHLAGIKTDSMLELSYPERKRVHNLKYYTWVEQQGKTAAELDAQWYDADSYWGGIHAQVREIDACIESFNALVRD